MLVADIDRSRLQRAETIGADETLLLSGNELVEEILRQTEGRGVDLVLEAVGRQEPHRRLNRQRAQGGNGYAHRQYFS